MDRRSRVRAGPWRRAAGRSPPGTSCTWRRRPRPPTAAPPPGHERRTGAATRIGPGLTETAPMPAEPGGDVAAFVAEIQTAVDGVTSGRMPELLSGQLARDALVMCYKECESVMSRKPVAMT